MGKATRVRQLKEKVKQEKNDIVGIQETIKKDFSDHELLALAPRANFVWNWIPAKGHSGRILLGVKNDILEVENWDKGEFFMGATVRKRRNNFRWHLMVVYSSAQHDSSRVFLGELKDRCENYQLPILMGVFQPDQVT
ncbi:uncharacterized protein LOC101762855 [Setaria italica]|uniref:uncharacterized protein LOC101762855 n=1 Tax=Setaria italica TaxID=4555 RepID=UPI0003509A0F|nr:uncharacterized protein LOC101762855 [Setaria italica]